ncbi:Pfs domain protein [Aspergillus heteromorphus CBS 117.55]|uniref:Pfs domain protein n=1 Tax=Aspergillus heteromorphus CBS 117.55 TaxID=1448321 RepID=A0A317VR19_9EURO|nr:Pfs domain protein [Aspergillus heteromorphus CBS 117.55]PWY75467.1 Pfs domain protein [Aspergillus heteromorphus CBS 117.55]
MSWKLSDGFLVFSIPPHNGIRLLTLQPNAQLKTIFESSLLIGWIAALSFEIAAATAMLDEIHTTLPSDFNDHNSYTLWSILGDNVVIACLPASVNGATSAAIVAAHMLFTFPEIRFGLMVGIGGGAPSDKVDIRLGDVVVSEPADGVGGVIQYDYGTVTSGGSFQRTGALNKPPLVLLAAVNQLKAKVVMKNNNIPLNKSQIAMRYPKISKFTCSGNSQDHLYKVNYEHVGGNTCDHCSKIQIMNRQSRPSADSAIHYGLIASGNQVMKHAATRDRLAQELGILCFEMEAAGLIDPQVNQQIKQPH